MAAGRERTWAARRIDERLLTGRGRYVGAVGVEGQLWMGVVRSQVPHGEVRAIDCRQARALDGISAVLTPADLETVPVIPGRPHTFPGSMEPFRQTVLATDRTRYVGEPLAVVVGDDPYVVEDAVELVVADIEPLPVATGVGDRSVPLWHDADGDALFRLEARHGDVDACFDRAAVVVEAELDFPRQTGLPMETRGLVAEWRDGGRELHVWGPTKAIPFTRSALAGMFDLAPSRVVCHGIDVGGMFGVRGEFYPEDFLVPWAAAVTGRPVKWIEDRREHLLAINHSRQQRHRLAIALDADGALLAFRDDVVIDAGAYARPAGDLLGKLTISALPGPYRWEALAVTCAGVATNKTPVGTMRSPCVTEAAFARERTLDIAAGRLGITPAEIRRRNLVTADDGPWRLELGDPVGQVAYQHDDFRALFDDFLERTGHERLQREVAERRARGELVGLGLACFVEGTGAGATDSVTLELTSEGRFAIHTTASEVGQGLTDMVVAVAADALGVSPDDVDVSVGDTSGHDGGVGTFGSRSTIFLSGAVRDGAERLLSVARARAAATLGVDPGTLRVSAEGLAAGEDLLHWKELGPATVRGEFVQQRLTYGFGTHLAVVSVAADTSEPQVEELVVGYDCGDVLDAASVHGQLVGAAVLGLGGTLFESLRYDADGQPTTTTLVDYQLPTSQEVGRVDAHVLSPPERPRGAVLRGAGEAGVVGVPAAVTNAVAAALGVSGAELVRLPLTPSGIAAVLRAGERSQEDAAVAGAPPARPSWWRRPPVVVAGGLGAVAVLSWLLSRARGRRRP